MNKRSCVWMIVALFLASAPVLFGATAGHEDESAEFFAGVVLAVDTDAGKLSLEEASLEGEKMSFLIAPETEIRRNGETAELADIEIGDPVSVEYVRSDGKNVARSVEVIIAPTATTQ